MTTINTPFRRKYLVKNRVANLFIRVVDTFLSVFVFLFGSNHNNKKIVAFPSRILLSNSAHMGDVLILTSVFPLIKNAFPESKIGLLIGSWSLPIVKDSPIIEWVHVVDHWKLNRANNSLWHKMHRHFKTSNKALREIKEIKYDAVIDFYCFFPNSIVLTWLAMIPIRVGYTSGGFGPLLTHPKEWFDLNQHISQYHVDILQLLHPLQFRSDPLRYCPPSIGDHFNEEAVTEASTHPINYIVIHMGTGEILREWPVSNWRLLSEALIADGNDLVFTGTGQRELENVSSVIDGLSNCINMCGVLSWYDFVSTIKNASLVICVESLAAHIAASFEINCVAIFSGMSNHNHWRPLSERVRLVFNPLPCAPCYKSRGCDTMACVRDVHPYEVYLEAKEQMDQLKKL